MSLSDRDHIEIATQLARLLSFAVDKHGGTPEDALNILLETFSRIAFEFVDQDNEEAFTAEIGKSIRQMFTVMRADETGGVQ